MPKAAKPAAAKAAPPKPKKTIAKAAPATKRAKPAARKPAAAKAAQKKTVARNSPARTVNYGTATVTATVTIVGLQFQPRVGGRANVHAHEFVQLVREPENIHDENAIRVDNLDNMKVGYIAAWAAAKLAPIMDDPSQSAPKLAVYVSAVPGGAAGPNWIDATLTIRGMSDKARSIADALIEARAIAAALRRRTWQSAGYATKIAKPAARKAKPAAFMGPVRPHCRTGMIVDGAMIVD